MSDNKENQPEHGRRETKENRFLKILKPILTWRMLGAVVVGGALGYAYYHFYGCNGSCPINSNPYNTIAYGALTGAILGYK